MATIGESRAVVESGRLRFGGCAPGWHGWRCREVPVPRAISSQFSVRVSRRFAGSSSPQGSGPSGEGPAAKSAYHQNRS